MDTIREEIPSLDNPATHSTNSSPSHLQKIPADTDLPRSIPVLGAPTVSGALRGGVGRVRADLAKYGPGVDIPPLAIDEAFAYCQQLAHVHYENFSVVTQLVPARIRPHLTSIYAYCRWSDDLADEMDDSVQACELLAWWREQLDHCFSGQASHPVFLALRQTVSQYRLSPEPFQDLLSAFLQDQSQTRYETDSDLLKYCERSANPVGRLVSKLAGVGGEQEIGWSDSICTGLQLANFCQDIRLDAKRDRIYWPAERLRKWNIDPDILSLSAPVPAICDGLKEWTEDARHYLVNGLPLVQRGPLWFARSVQLFARGGLMILRNINLQSNDVWSRCVNVSKVQKLQLMIRSFLFPRSMRIPAIDCPAIAPLRNSSNPPAHVNAQSTTDA